ncbi:MAG: phosphatase PAP2 family protein [Actinomycetota bacterium]|nr:phosphatase PAP2 family protein [Actinomycetota bacterium]
MRRAPKAASERIERSTRRRRPSGEPAPLPKEPLAGLGWLWILSLSVVVAIIALLLTPTSFFLGRGDWWNSFDGVITDWFVSIRNDPLNEIARAFDALRTDWFLTVLRWASVAVLLVTMRWRHLFTFVVVVLGTELFVVGLANLLSRPRPDGVTILTDWAGFAAPSLAGAAVAVTLVAMTYALVVPGKWRQRALLASTIVIVTFALARVYLGVDRVSDVASGEIIAVALAVLAFRLITPDSVFPVSYARGKTAHLEMSGTRIEAIVVAMQDQLGYAVVAVEPFGLEGSGGSTPLRITLSDNTHVFGKLYANNHLRSDRWYKLGRTILYGSLEDESSFRTVRRLAEHEDHVMRLMRDAGVPIPEPLGIVELTPGREYMLVTEFLDGVAEMSEAEVDEGVVDSAMWSVSKMWDQGLAHRDIKPANVLVGRRGLYLIDHAFGEIRPSPWRQAIDLANMMLSLAAHLPTAVIYERARDHFSEDDLAEAFAATRGVTIPGELRNTLKAMDHDAQLEFRNLAPQRSPIRIQRWTRRRVLGLCALVVIAAFAVWLVLLNRSMVRELL